MLGLGVSIMTPIRTIADFRRLNSVVLQHLGTAAHPVRQIIVNRQLVNRLLAIGKSRTGEVEEIAQEQGRRKKKKPPD
jgi:hypothetical protein